MKYFDLLFVENGIGTSRTLRQPDQPSRLMQEIEDREAMGFENRLGEQKDGL